MRAYEFLCYEPVPNFGGITAYGGYDGILHCAEADLSIMLNRDLVQVKWMWVADPDLIRELGYLYSVAGSIVLNCESALQFGPILLKEKQLGSVDLDLSMELHPESATFTAGSGDDYEEIEIYRELTSRLGERGHCGRLVIQNPGLLEKAKDSFLPPSLARYLKPA